VFHRKFHERKNTQGRIRKHVFENGVVQGAVLSVTFLIAMSEISDGIQETVKIKG
jgi:hypothetical protein